MSGAAERADGGRPTAIVTGASRGIGRACAVELAAVGHHVVINFRERRAAAEETLTAVRAAGGEGELLAFDVADGEATKTALEGLFERRPRIDALVNNAGVTADGLFATMSADDWHRVLATSLDGFYHVTRPVVRRMIRHHGGSIVTVASLSGLTGNRGQANYAAAKAGDDANLLLRALAEDIRLHGRPSRSGVAAALDN